MDDEKDYPVGYKKPPLHSRFKPGQSGNPKGRPKKQGPTLFEVVHAEFSTLVRMSESGGAPRKMSKLQAVVKLFMAQALQRDIKAAMFLLKIYGQLEPDSDETLLQLVEGLKEVDAELEAAASKSSTGSAGSSVRRGDDEKA